jgi:hypothetical protein
MCPTSAARYAGLPGSRAAFPRATQTRPGLHAFARYAGYRQTKAYLKISAVRGCAISETRIPLGERGAGILQRWDVHCCRDQEVESSNDTN